MKRNKLIYYQFNKDPFHTHMKILRRVKPFSNVLEIGCATGYMTNQLLQKGCMVTALEKDNKMAKIAHLKTGIPILNCDVCEINHFLKKRKKFDFIILADILEHLTNPLETLINLKGYLKPITGKMLISLPNIANFAIRFNLFFFSDFSYQDWGILDKNHLRFFSKKTAEKMLEEASLEVVGFDTVAGFEVSDLYRKTIGRITFRVLPLRFLEDFITKIFPSFFALEFIYEVRNK